MGISKRSNIFILIYTIFLLFEFRFRYSRSEELSDFSNGILKLCKDYNRLKAKQLVLLESWINEFLNKHVTDFSTRYNLKRCRKSILKKLNNKMTLKEKLSRLFIDKKLETEKSVKLKNLELAKKNILDFNSDQFNELSKFTEEKNPEKNEKLDTSNLKSRIKLIPETVYDRIRDDILKTIGPDTKVEEQQMIEIDVDNVKMIREDGPVSDYLDDNGKPIIRETEHFNILHDSVTLLVPERMPMLFNYNKIPRPNLPIQPMVISITYFVRDGIDEVETNELTRDDESSIVSDSISEDDSSLRTEIIDAKVDYYDAPDTSSESDLEYHLTDSENGSNYNYNLRSPKIAKFRSRFRSGSSSNILFHTSKMPTFDRERTGSTPSVFSSESMTLRQRPKVQNDEENLSSERTRETSGVDTSSDEKTSEETSSSSETSDSYGSGSTESSEIESRYATSNEDYSSFDNSEEFKETSS